MRRERPERNRPERSRQEGRRHSQRHQADSGRMQALADSRPRRANRKISRGSGGSGRGGPALKRRRLGLVSGVLAILLALMIGFSLSDNSGHAADGNPGVRVIPVEGIIDPQVADFVLRAIDEAENDGTQVVVLRLDTPGGLDSSMRDIIKEMAGSPLPVIAWVAPPGARAASAGTFIVTGSDVAAMASGTNLGAAHPVAIGAEPSTEEGIKITNDAAAYIRSLAEANGRNANWAELAVRQSVSLSADEALGKQVIDFKADTIDSLLAEVNGYTTTAKGITLVTADASVTEASMSAKENFLHLILNPNVAYLLFIYGLIALIYEFVHPGIGLGGVTGTIALVLSIYAMYMLPVNFVGLTLVFVGLVMLAMELYLPSHGALSVGGVASLIMGSFFLFDSTAPFLRISLPVNIALALMALAFFVLIAGKIMKARRLPPRTGQKAMIGEVGYTRSPLDPLGQIFVHGEIWSAESIGGEPIPQGVEVEVADVRGLMLKVKPVK